MFETEATRHSAAAGAGSAPSVLDSVAADWGYGCSVVVAELGDDGPVIEGRVLSHKLPCGMNLCASDLKTLRDNERSGELQRSLTIAVCLEGSPLRYRLNGGERIELDPLRAVAVAAADEMTMFSRYRAGERSSVLVAQASPADIADDELRERLDRLLEGPPARPMACTDRAVALARSLLEPAHCGVIQRLRAESCALELLATALDGEASTAGANDLGVRARDVSKILSLRDRLATEFDVDHRLCDLARDAGMSVSVLKVKFAAVVGRPVIQFLRDCRLERARQGLAREGWTVSEAAAYVGYRHSANFSTAFRRRYGVSPTAESGRSRLQSRSKDR